MPEQVVLQIESYRKSTGQSNTGRCVRNRALKIILLTIGVNLGTLQNCWKFYLP